MSVARRTHFRAKPCKEQKRDPYRATIMNTLRHASALELSIKRELILVSLLGAVLMSACSPRAARREVPHFENPYSEARDLLTDAGRTYTKVGDTMQSILDKPPSEQEKIDQLMGSWVVFS